MNKQFSDLFDKAVMEQCLANGDPVDNSQAILERFAELIVLECGRFVNRTVDRVEMKEHFGVNDE